MVACNRRVGCAPFESKAVETEVKTGFAVVKNKAVLVPLKVEVADADGCYAVGSRVWVRGESVKLQWALEQFEVGGKKIILVPVDAVLLHAAA